MLKLIARMLERFAALSSTLKRST